MGCMMDRAEAFRGSSLWLKSRGFEFLRCPAAWEDGYIPQHLLFYFPTAAVSYSGSTRSCSRYRAFPSVQGYVALLRLCRESHLMLALSHTSHIVASI